MHRIAFISILAVVAIAPAATVLGQGSRREAARINIKRATDPAAANLKLTPTKTTVEDLLQMSRPEGLAADASNPDAQNKRYGPLETTVWQVEATIKEIVLRADGDFYMVIEGASGARTVVEVPDPRLCPNSKLIKRIQEVRNLLAKKFHPTAQPLKVDQKALITGVGYFGFQSRNAQGTQNNGARLMPGIEVKLTQ